LVELGVLDAVSLSKNPKTPWKKPDPEKVFAKKCGDIVQNRLIYAAKTLSCTMTLQPNNIYCGDCLDLMDGISGESVDMVLCDLPYQKTQNKWDNLIPLDVLWPKYKRCAKRNAAFVFFAAQPFTSFLVVSNLKDFKYDWVWKKPKGTGHLNAKKMPMRDKEDILVFYREQCVYNPQFCIGKPYKDKAGKNHAANTSMTDSYGKYTNFRNDNEGKRYPKQVLDFPVVERGTVHPTQKPVGLLEYLIKTYTNEGDVVLDNAMGSGSTVVAAIRSGRKYIGIEKDELYFKKAKERVENEQAENRQRLLRIH
jgi:site-specific DNA-methyltransferase (adenine-specific)